MSALDKTSLPDFVAVQARLKAASPLNYGIGVYCHDCEGTGGDDEECDWDGAVITGSSAVCSVCKGTGWLVSPEELLALLAAAPRGGR